MNIKKPFILLLFLFFTYGMLKAQSASNFTGKPMYQILAKRAGVSLGVINIELFPKIAPRHVRNFDSLVSKKFYDTTAFHRVIPGFMIQGGDPNSRHGPKSTWGYGDPSQPKVNAEFSAAKHLRGILSAARSTDINSATSQFFICVATAASLDGKYSIYGHVTSGMSIVDNIVNSPRDANDNPNQKIEMFITYLGSNDTLPNAPVLISPVSGTQNVSLSKTLTWNTVSDAILYHVEISVDSLFSTTFKSADVVVPTYTVTGLSGSTKYFWRVKSNNGGNVSLSSSVWSFSTVYSTGINNALSQHKRILLEQNVPNPCKGKTEIKYIVPEKANVILKLVDITGRELAVLVNEARDQGEYSLILDLDKFSDGIYFYQIEAGGFMETKKLMLQK